MHVIFDILQHLRLLRIGLDNFHTPEMRQFKRNISIFIGPLSTYIKESNNLIQDLRIINFQFTVLFFFDEITLKD
jgi:hypothetical protein